MRVEQCEAFHARAKSSPSQDRASRRACHQRGGKTTKKPEAKDADSVRDETTTVTGVFLRSPRPRNQPRTAQRGVDIVDALPKTCKRVGARVGTWTKHAPLSLSLSFGGSICGGITATNRCSYSPVKG